MDNAVTINSQVVEIIQRETVCRSTAAGDYSIESFTVKGKHTEWPIGTEVAISFPEGMIRGKVTNSWTDPRKDITHVRVYRSIRLSDGE